MSVFRVEKTRDYTVMSNYHLRDRTISLKSKGLLTQMLSLPEDWDYTMKGLALINKDGVGSVKSALDELEEAGYVLHRRIRNEKGQLKGTEYFIFEYPISPEEKERFSDPTYSFPILDLSRCGDHTADRTGREHVFYTSAISEPITPEPILEKPIQVSPILDEPAQDQPILENPAHLNINLPITQKQNTNSSNTHSFPSSGEERRSELDADEIETRRQEIREQIDYEFICTASNRNRVDELVETILGVMFEMRPTMQIGKRTLPTAYVRDRFRALTGEHIQHVLDGFDDNTTAVRYPTGYILASLFNSISTIGTDYAMRVNHDFYGK